MSERTLYVFLKHFYYVFIRLPLALIMACRVFDLPRGVWTQVRPVGSNALTSGGIQAPCTGSAGLSHWTSRGIPLFAFLIYSVRIM